MPSDAEQEVESILGEDIRPVIDCTTLGEMAEKLAKEEGLDIDHPSTWRIAARRIHGEIVDARKALEKSQARAAELEEAGQLELGKVAEETKRRQPYDPATAEIGF